MFCASSYANTIPGIGWSSVEITSHTTSKTRLSLSEVSPGV